MAGKPLQVGLTGGIGSGKSLVCKIFNILGIPSYDADSRAKWLMDQDPVLKAKITQEFGERAYSRTGRLNREYLADLAFNDDRAILVLNQLVHPVVGQDYLVWVEKQSFSSYVLKEAALIFETGTDAVLDKVITVNAPEDVRIQRVMARDPQRSRTQIDGIISKQWTERQRQDKADFVIVNDGATMVIPQVLETHKRLTEVVDH